MNQSFKKYFETLRPSNIPQIVAGKGDLLPIQERILHTLYIGSSLFALVAIILSTVNMIAVGVRPLPAAFAFISLILIIFTFWRNSPYRFRAYTFIAILYFATIITFYRSGFASNGGAILLCCIILATIFFGPGSGLRHLLLSLFIYAIFAFLFQNKLVPAPDPVRTMAVASPFAWFQFSLPLVFLAGLTATSISLLLKILGPNLSQARIQTTVLQAEQKKMDRLLQEGIAKLGIRELQLRTASQIARDISSTLDPKALLSKVVESIRENFNTYYVGIFLVDPEERYAVLRAGSGEAGQKMIAAGHRLEVGGSSMIGWCVANRKARISMDVGEEQIHFNNPYLPNTRSELALPIVFQNKALGALTIQSTKPNAFNDDDIVVLQGISDSLAISLENANLFQNAQQAIDELRYYNKANFQETWGHTLAQGDLAYSFQNQTSDLAGGELHEVNIPITLRQEKIGEFHLETANETISSEDRDFLDAILVQTALALENARMIEETQRRALQEQKLNDLSTQLSKASSIEYILQTAARELGQLPMVSEVSVQLLSHEDETSPARAGSNGKEQ